jgi:hypothetical protein
VRLRIRIGVMKVFARGVVWLYSLGGMILLGSAFCTALFVLLILVEDVEQQCCGGTPQPRHSMT